MGSRVALELQIYTFADHVVVSYTVSSFVVIWGSDRECGKLEFGPLFDHRRYVSMRPTWKGVAYLCAHKYCPQVPAAGECLPIVLAARRQVIIFDVPFASFSALLDGSIRKTDKGSDV